MSSNQTLLSQFFDLMNDQDELKLRIIEIEVIWAMRRHPWARDQPHTFERIWRSCFLC